MTDTLTSLSTVAKKNLKEDIDKFDVCQKEVVTFATKRQEARFAALIMCALAPACECANGALAPAFISSFSLLFLCFVR